jgi:hypothetical protein
LVDLLDPRSLPLDPLCEFDALKWIVNFMLSQIIEDRRGQKRTGKDREGLKMRG